ncbi:MAG: radical SAM protein [Oligoflexales bacterium]|nr:radical SAM protein [Oligoflexales bacterium]
MKVLLIAPNRTVFPYRVTPVGILYLASRVSSSGHEARILDLMFVKDYEGAVERVVREFSPGAVGIGIRNIDDIVSKNGSYLSYYKKCIETIRRISKVPIVIGGSAFTTATDTFMKELKPDFGLSGEADFSLPLLLQKIERGGDIESVPGISFYKDGLLKIGAPAYVEDLDSIENQAIHLIDYRKYMRNRGHFGVVTQRGCNQRCIFCNDVHLCGRKVRFRSARRVVDEIEAIRKTTGMKYFGLADPLFNTDRDHMMRVLRELARRKLGIGFHVELNPINQDEESIRLLKEAGCICVDYTCDSGADSMLKAMKKGYSAQDAMAVAGLYAKYRIPYSVGFLVGGPSENRDTVGQTVRFAENLPGASVIYFSVGLVILPNSPLYEIAGNEGILKNAGDPSEVRYYVDKGFDAECARILISALRRNLHFYPSDFIFSQNIAFFWKLLDFMNLRPAYKFKPMIKYSFRLMPLGLGKMRWDEPQRRLVFTT